MKKKFASILLLGVCFFGGFEMVLWAEYDPINAMSENADTRGEVWTPSSSAGQGSSGWATTVTVTEKIPGMDCTGTNEGDITKRKYVCTIQPGFGSVILILKGLIKYTTFIVALIGVLMLVVSWVQYSISGADDGAAKDAKERIKKVLMGIILLFLIGFILNSVAPWVYR